MAKVTAFTDNEVKLICENYRKMSNKELAILLNNEENNNRTESSIKSKLNNLGLKRGDKNTWTPEELDILKRDYKTKTNVEIQEELFKVSGNKRSIQTIGAKASDLGLTNPRYDKYWNEEEKGIINSVLSKANVEDAEPYNNQDSQEQQEPQEEKFNPKAEGKRYEYIRKYIKDKDINLLIRNSISFFGISDLFICNSVNMSYQEFNKKYFNDCWSIQDKINISNFIQDYFIGCNKINIEELYK